MSAAEHAAAVPGAKPARRRRNWRNRLRKWPPLGALFCGIVLVVAALFGSMLAPHAPDAANFGATLRPPFWMEGGSLEYFFGTDQLGRDLLSRLIAGTQISLLTAFAAIIGGGSIGVAVGLVAGYAGPKVNALFMRIIDAFLALPFILMALALVAALGSGIWNIVLVMVITNWARYARLVQSEVISIKSRDFVALAQIAGVRPVTIVLRHVLPNAMNSVAVLAVLDVGRAIILESSLSFLGLGIQPPSVSWGLMLADGRAFMAFAWWMTALPGLCIFIAILSFNALGDWLKRRLDPRGTI